MSPNVEPEWRWYRCSIMGCGAGPLRVRPHPRFPDRWSVGFSAGAPSVTPGPEPLCPRCGHWLEALAPGA